MNGFRVSVLCVMGGGLGFLSAMGTLQPSEAQTPGSATASPAGATVSQSPESPTQAYAALRTELLAILSAPPDPSVKPNPWDVTDKVKPLVEKAQQLHGAGDTTGAKRALGEIDQGLNVRNAKPILTVNYYYTVGRLNESLGLRAEALEQYTSCKNHMPLLPPVHQRLVMEGEARTNIAKEEAELKTLEQAKDYRGMAKVLERIVARWPEDVKLLSEWAWALVRAGDGAAAKQVALRTLPLVTDSTKERAVRYNLGRAHELLGEREAAIAAYRGALYLRLPEGLLRDSYDQQLPTEGQLGEIASALRRLGSFPLLPLAQPLDPDPGKAEGCREAKQAKLAAPFVGVKLCSNDSEVLALTVETTAGSYRNAQYYDLNRGARDDHDLSLVEVQQGRLLVHTQLRRGRWYNLRQEFLTLCAAGQKGVSCVGPVEISRSNQSYSGSKETRLVEGKEVKEFEYRARLLPGDVVEFTAVKPRRNIDLTGKVSIKFP